MKLAIKKKLSFTWNGKQGKKYQQGMKYTQRLQEMKKKHKKTYIKLTDVLRKMSHAILERTVLWGAVWRIRDEMPYGTRYVL